MTLYATLATSKSPSSDETLVVQATKTNGGTQEVARSTYTVTPDEYTNAAETFALSDPGEYLITASLVGDDEVYEAGTLTVEPASNVGITSTSITPSDAAVGEVVTVEATLENTGSAEATVTPQFFENGAVFAEDSVTLATGETTTLTETYTLSEQRLHQFHIGVVEPAVIEHVGDIYPATGGAVSLSTGVDPSGTVSEGEDATFTAMATHDSGESITEYRWDFGDGTTTTTASNTATHAYSRVGSFQYTVTAIADDGATATDAGVVTVSAERILIQDGFEEGSLDNWEVERPNFALTDDALTGAKSAQLYPSGSETDDKHAYIISKDEFPQGSTYQVTFEVYGSSGDFGMSYAVQGDEDYTISYLPKGTDNPRFDIRRTKDGTTKTLATKAPEVSWGKRTTMTIENLDGEIRVTVTDGTTTDTLTATDDDPLTHGGKFRLHGYEKVIIDDLIVEK